MFSSYNEFPLMLLRDCVYKHLHVKLSILREIELDNNYRILSAENEYSKDFYVNLYKPKFEGFVALNPMQYILKVDLNSNKRLRYEVFDQGKLEKDGYSTMSHEEFYDYKEESIRIVKDVNKMLDKIGNEKFPKSWEEYKNL